MTVPLEMNRSIIISFYAFISVSLSLYAARINDIIVKSSVEKSFSKELVYANLIFQKDEEFSPSNLSQAIKILYATKKFDDIEAQVIPVEGEMVDIMFVVTPKPVVDEVTFKGNKLISTSKLMEQVSHKKGSIFDERELSEDLKKLYESYHKKGYHDTFIEQEVVKNEETNQVKIIYKINEKARYKIRGLEIIGNSAFSDRKLKRMIESKVSLFGAIFPVGYFKEADLKNDQDVLQQAYGNQGYLDFKIEKIERSFNAEKSKIYLTIYIKEGPQYHIGSISISENEVFSNDEMLRLISLKSGQIYSRETEQKDISRITDRFNRKGYLDCYVRAKRTINNDTRTVAIDYVIKEGQQYTIRDINISGNRITKDEVIRRELNIYPNDIGDMGKIKASKSSLLNLGYFESIDIIPVSTEEYDKKDLNIKVSEKLTGQLLFGAGFSSTDNLLGTVEISQSNFDLFNYPSFRGGGQRFRLRAQTGASRRDLIVSFTEPWFLDKPLRLDFEAWDRTTSSNRDYDQDSIGTNINITRKMRLPFWRQSIGYRIENIDINDIDEEFSQEFVENEEGENLVSSLSLGFTRDHRDKLLFTSSGSRLSISTELQTEFLGSYTNLYKLNLSIDKYFPVFKQAVFKISGQIGQVTKIDGEVPKVFDRFFAGGANSIRGFKERDVGPIDTESNEETIGGRSILLASMELTGPVYQQTIYWAAFIDSGNVWKKSFDWEISELNVGAGLGVRLFLPIGAVQLDYGWPLVREQDHLNRSGRFHFNLGYNF